jgi:RHS repeat-associated protein
MKYLSKFGLFVVCLFCGSAIVAQTTSQNYTTTRSYRTGTSVPVGSNPTGGIPVIQYADGLGRPVQSVLQQASPTTAQDIVVGATTYDEFGRPQKSLMPVRYDGATTGAYQDPTTIQTKAQAFYGDNSPFSVVDEYENSPLGRVKKQLGPGSAWQAGTKKTNNATYETNTVNIKRWTATNTTITGTTTFGVGTLSKSTSLDENSNTVVEYTDKEGRTIQKEVQENTGTIVTCYAYDNFGRLAYIIPPLLTATNQTSFTTANVIELVFAFRYDKRGRIVEKLTPGADWTYFVYNKLNQVVMSQNKRQRNNNQWAFSRYDALGRAIVSGLYKYTTAPTRTTLQGYFDAQTVNFYEITGGADNGYTQISMPASATSGGTYFPLAYRFYDNYSWTASLSGFGSGTGWAYNATDKLTGMKLRVLEPNVSTVVWLDNVFYYDDRNRVLNAYSRNFFGQINEANFTYDGLTDDALTETTLYRRASATTTLKNTYEYDNRGRVTRAKNQINTEPEVILAEYEYDDIVRLKRKKIQPGSYRIIGEAIDQLTVNTLQTGTKTDSAKVQITLASGFGVARGANYTACITGTGSGTSANYLQTIDYSYHIRGGLKCINCDAAGALALSKPENDLFAMKLDYETAIDGVSYFNGNIRQQSWISLNNPTAPRVYKYVYDKVDRLTDANYSGGKFTGENYSMTGVTYDKNGNIQTLQRKGQTSTTTGGSFGNIDQLTYTYKTASGYASNKINTIADAITTNPDVGDFRDKANTTDYDFYTDGSLQADRNKGIASIQYNELGLPSVLAFANNQFLRFTYDAAGNKLSKEVVATAGSYHVYDDGDITYSDAFIATIRHDEGRYLPAPSGSLTGGAYEYQYHDHLGNLRVAYRQPAPVRNSSLRLSAEPQNAPTEEAQFRHVADTREGGIAYEGDHAIELQGEVGPSKEITLMAGEKLTATVMGYYPQPVPEKKKIILPVPILTQSPLTPDGGTTVSKWQLKLGLLLPFTFTKKAPLLGAGGAFLQLVVLDSAKKVIHTERKYLDTAAINGWQKLQIDAPPAPDGGATVQVSLVNDNARVAAYFDNLTITQDPPLIVQEMHYDPWGVELVGITTRGAPEDLDQFNAGSEKTYLLGDKTYYYQTDFRFYDPQRAQWGDIDLLGQFASAYDFVGGNPMGFVDPTGLLGVFVGETIVRGAGAGLAKGLTRTVANIGANLLIKQITPAGSTRVDKPILPSQIKPSKPQATPQPQLSASKPRSTFQLDMKALSGNMEYWQNYGGSGILHTLASPVTDIIASHYEARLNDGMYGRSYWRGVGIKAKGTSRAWTVIGAVQGGAALFGGAAVKTSFYRAMSNAEYAALEANNGLTYMAGKELFVSSEAAYSRAYLQKSGYDVLVQFTMKPGAANYFTDVTHI